jgi:hypothetical protein
MPAAYGPPGYGQPAGYGWPQYSPYGAQPRTTNGLAIASLVCSLAGFITCVSAPAGVVLGHIARRQIRQTGEQGDGLALAGLWIGYVVSVLALLGVIGYVALIVLTIRETST